MEYFLINPSSSIERLRVGCVTKHKDTFEDIDGKFTKGIYEILECCGIDHIGFPHNEKNIVGGFIVDEDSHSYPHQSVFGFHLSDGYHTYIGGKSLFYTESNHSEEEVREFLDEILFFPKDEMENTILYDMMIRESNVIKHHPNSNNPIPFQPYITQYF